MSAKQNMSPFVKKMRWLALISHVALIVWMAVWYFGLSNIRDYSTTFIFLVYILPLLFPLKGIVQGKPYTHAWTSFIVLLYFLHAITVIYAEPSQILYASIELALAVSLFTGCSVYARLRGQELGIGLKKLSVVMAEEKKRFEG
ncbi:DUF2069 domain-containing protein [Glaciecola sp. KUL10]|uniref:DUF2069 domain-containing protein n=1 Tax=Glaciecola sp. (strain KUL10) TaxID=2161813 RepID=UPI000D94C68B|nr:DUF2069 domain-containing protein [Glaciecola sp. KUL10]GBL03002.1 hypothetical protein KUL10_02790 [Glaciecola sp. KUL10]